MGDPAYSLLSLFMSEEFELSDSIKEHGYKLGLTEFAYALAKATFFGNPSPQEGRVGELFQIFISLTINDVKEHEQYLDYGLLKFTEAHQKLKKDFQAFRVESDKIP